MQQLSFPGIDIQVLDADVETAVRFRDHQSAVLEALFDTHGVAVFEHHLLDALDFRLVARNLRLGRPRSGNIEGRPAIRKADAVHVFFLVEDQ